MSFQLKGYLVILLLLIVGAVIIWAPWRAERPAGMPRDIFEPFDGQWQGRFSSYGIEGGEPESFRQSIHLESISADSQVGVVVTFNPKGDTLSRDSLFHVRRGDSLYRIRISEGGPRELNRGYWADRQFFWRSQDIFGRVQHAYRERIRKDVWETDGFARTHKGDYLLEYGRAIRR
jgi:hypothetical protein